MNEKELKKFGRMDPNLKSRWKFHQNIEANWQNSGLWFPGNIAWIYRYLNSIRYVILYEDGDFEYNVPQKQIRKRGYKYLSLKEKKIEEENFQDEETYFERNIQRSTFEIEKEKQSSRKEESGNKMLKEKKENKQNAQKLDFELKKDKKNSEKDHKSKNEVIEQTKESNKNSVLDKIYEIIEEIEDVEVIIKPASTWKKKLLGKRKLPKIESLTNIQPIKQVKETSFKNQSVTKKKDICILEVVNNLLSKISESINKKENLLSINLNNFENEELKTKDIKEILTTIQKAFPEFLYINTKNY
eukprot:snap_masked-scaffold_50-processed-gene-1.39-mRNA-1 protein AED:1.00 eAED:1.00 QI:0/0/0/0/1/1/2/0/300